MKPGLMAKWGKLSLLEVVIIVVLACVPLFVSFPYRVNIFLSWEGAYRVSEGELPFRDFGTPLGGVYWLIPGFFFKLFGTQMISLVKAQVLINILSGLAFRSILSSCRVEQGIRFISVLLYCISFSFFNFWPWYNHTVIVYEFIGLAFLLSAVTNPVSGKTWLKLIAAAFFTSCSFLTKQDAGGMALMLSLAIVLYTSIHTRKWMMLAVYAGSFILIMFAVIAPFLSYGFSYWFNHGQPPHTGRISPFEILNEFFSGSQWLKFYIFLIVVLLVMRFRQWKEIWNNQQEMILLLLTFGILAQAAIFQITSYTPPDNNIFYHSFAIAYILTLLSKTAVVSFNKPSVVLVCTLGICLWWSQVYWKYIDRIVQRAFPSEKPVVKGEGENVVNRQTFMINLVDTTEEPMSSWKFTPLKSFEKIYMPSKTVEGIARLMNMEVVKNTKDIRVLNMSELTPLAAEIPYTLEKGSHYPLWYHLGVSMFNKEAAFFEKKIANKEYDLVLFEYIHTLNNFYPFRIRDSLKLHYTQVDSFPAPRRGETRGIIEVYTK